MLEIRPNCEFCDVDLPADSLEAFICSYECTFCIACVDNLLHNICPNCGGGFSPRPIRPGIEFREGVSLELQPASEKRIHSPYTKEQIKQFIKTVSEQ